MLRWAIQPFMLMTLGSGVLIVAAVSVFLLSERLFAAWNTPTVLFAVGALIAIISVALMRLTQVDR